MDLQMEETFAQNELEIEKFAGQLQPETLKTMNKTALDILMRMFRQQLSGIQKPSNCPPIPERCDEKPLWNALMGQGFLLLFLLAVIGNCLNVLIYKSDQIRFFIAIRMLCTKLLMNTCMMVVMLPQALRVIRLWDIGGSTDQLYWRLWPYQAYLTNVFGFCAMWLTVLMTAECYVHIFFPSHSKAVCTKQTVWRSYLLILSTALILASIYPLNRTVLLMSNSCDRTIVKIVTSQHPALQFLEKLHTIGDMFLSILVPLSLLVFMTLMIVWRLWAPLQHQANVPKEKQPLNVGQQPSSNVANGSAANRKSVRGRHFAAEKRGVTRITLITCAIQLVTEMPSMSVLIYVSMFGPNVHKEEHICSWQTVSYFLCLCNASLSFFVYITFSTRFRKTMLNRTRRFIHRILPTLIEEDGGSKSLKHSEKGSSNQQQHQQLPTSNNSCCSSHMALPSGSRAETPARRISQQQQQQKEEAVEKQRRSISTSSGHH